MQRKFKRLLIFLFILGLILAYVFHFDQYLTLETIKMHRVHLKNFVHRHYLPSVLIYIAAYIVFIALSLPTGGLLTLTGGFLFGVLPATLYVVLGATTGAALAFLLTRYLVGGAIAQQYPRYTKRMSYEVAKYGSSYMLMLRLAAIVPFFIVNLVAATTTLSLFTFVWTTALGIIPATMVFAFAGQELGTINELSDIFSRNIIIAFVLLGFFASLPMIVQRLRKRRKI